MPFPAKPIVLFSFLLGVLLFETACSHERVGHTFSVSPIVDRSTPAIAKLDHPDCTWVTRIEASALISGLNSNGAIIDEQAITELFYCCPRSKNRRPVCEKALFPSAKSPELSKPEPVRQSLDELERYEAEERRRRARD